MEVIVNGIPNKVYSQGIETRDMWVEVFRRFGKENSIINAYDFYAGDRFTLSIHLRSMRDNNNWVIGSLQWVKWWPTLTFG